MTQQVINIGAAPDDRTGTPWRDGGDFINDNFGELYITFAVNEIYITELSNFPAPVGGVITLAANTKYIVTTAIDLGVNEIAYSANSDIQGFNSSIASLTSSTTGFLLTANQVALRVGNLTLACPNGTLFNHTGTVTAAVIIRAVVAFNYTNVAQFTNTHSGVVESASFIGGVNGFVFTGTGTGNIVFQFFRLTGFSGTGFDLGTAVFDTFALIELILSGLGGSTTLSIAASSANVTTRGSVVGCTFNGAGTALSGGTVFDLKWIYKGNFGLQDSSSDIWDVLTSPETVTIATQSVYVAINGGNWAATVDNRFSATTAGLITYNGLETIVFKITAASTVEKVGGGGDKICTKIALNGTVDDDTIACTDNTSPTGVLSQALFTLTTGNTIQLFVGNEGSTSNIIVSESNLIITEA